MQRGGNGNEAGHFLFPIIIPLLCQIYNQMWYWWPQLYLISLPLQCILFFALVLLLHPLHYKKTKQALCSTEKQPLYHSQLEMATFICYIMNPSHLPADWCDLNSSLNLPSFNGGFYAKHLISPQVVRSHYTYPERNLLHTVGYGVCKLNYTFEAMHDLITGYKKIMIEEMLKLPQLLHKKCL